jgi:hypothetical protein
MSLGILIMKTVTYARNSLIWIGTFVLVFFFGPLIPYATMFSQFLSRYLYNLLDPLHLVILSGEGEDAPYEFLGIIATVIILTIAIQCFIFMIKTYLRRQQTMH